MSENTLVRVKHILLAGQDEPAPAPPVVATGVPKSVPPDASGETHLLHPPTP